VTKHEGMRWVEGGSFLMGSDRHYPEEAPAHRARVSGFFMDETPVTNRQFRRFVEGTGYVTFAERPPDPQMYPTALPALLVPGSAVFFKTTRAVNLGDCSQWWQYVPGADWRHPEGPESSVDDRDEHPVVHLAYEDAEAYAAWSGKSLPTEAEWEFAARGGLEGAAYVWGEEFAPGGTVMAKTWQGEFPWQNLLADGFERTSPVRSYPPNGFGLFDMAGNVWEWTSDFFTLPPGESLNPCCVPSNPRVTEAEPGDPTATDGHIPRRVIKGGSHLCAPNYCLRYRPAARQGEAIDTSTRHIGFRLIVR
jgi:formylglycine-generating enzyme